MYGRRARRPACRPVIRGANLSDGAALKQRGGWSGEDDRWRLSVSGKCCGQWSRRSAAPSSACGRRRASGGAAAAQGAVRSVHGDWQIRCDTPPGAQGEQCALMQSVTAEDRPNVGLTVIVLKTTDQKSRLMRVVAPLGVLAAVGAGPEDRQRRRRPRRLRALPAQRLRRRSGHGRQADQADAHRPDLDLHHFPDARGRHRLSR